MLRSLPNIYSYIRHGDAVENSWLAYWISSFAFIVMSEGSSYFRIIRSSILFDTKWLVIYIYSRSCLIGSLSSTCTSLQSQIFFSFKISNASKLPCSWPHLNTLPSITRALTAVTAVGSKYCTWLCGQVMELTRPTRLYVLSKKVQVHVHSFMVSIDVHACVYCLQHYFWLTTIGVPN